MEDCVLTPHEDLRSASGLVNERARLDRRCSGAYNGHFLLAVYGIVGDLRGVPKQIRGKALEISWHALKVGEARANHHAARANAVVVCERDLEFLAVTCDVCRQDLLDLRHKSLAHLHSVRSEALHRAGFVIL